MSIFQKKDFQFWGMHIYSTGGGNSMTIKNDSSEVKFEIDNETRKIILKTIADSTECQEALKKSLNNAIGDKADLIFLK